MERDIQQDTIVLVTESVETDSYCCDRLPDTDYPVDPVTADSLETTLETVTPVGIVVSLEAVESIRHCLETVQDVATRVPTIVSPREGSEAIAAAAVRGGADEYVPLESDARRERIHTTLESGTETAHHQSESYHRILATELPDEGFVIAADGTYLEARLRPEATELYSMPAEELVGSGLADVFPEETARRLQTCIARTLETGDRQSIEYDAPTTEGRRWYEARVVPTDERVDGRRAVVWLARDITERVRREQELRSRQSELETFNKINAVGRQVFETLIDATDRDAIETAICSNLVDSELYSGSWIAERKPDGELVYRTGSGEAMSYLECVESRSADDGFPAAQAAVTDESHTVTRIREREPLPDPLQQAACDDDVESVLAVPIAYEDATYGVLTVLSPRIDAFSDHEQNGFELLGETMGFAIMAVKNRQLLFADSAVELEFRIDGGDSFSFDLTQQYDCTCTLEWTGMTTDGQTYQFVTIDGLDGETVCDEAGAHQSIETYRLVSDGTDQCTIEMQLCESGVQTLTNHGVTIRDVTVEDGVGNCLVEVSQDANVREIATALANVYEHTELVARRAVDRPVQTAAQRRDRILDELTDRQLTTLRLGYYGGFFEWPRESTGEEIADAMDISPPTMHQHLRKGLKTVLREFFENSAATGR
ncbi:PAS domain S-box protein [Salinadaptatus halalkaliphilus]|uniref:PAS domain S-box protein n=1 Tax=Salinadaptatus halalkaliphilus TaxID=2419781 RepID=A0A4V3VLM7_9EURY|nr:bacterio-opsin activator domain-containing protein [Salinadaptatus halalkaliphilus]THE66177.1 PAS domain S-box protein [Salinadaptatus halalkaliphilus]